MSKREGVRERETVERDKERERDWRRERESQRVKERDKERERDWRRERERERGRESEIKRDIERGDEIKETGCLQIFKLGWHKWNETNLQYFFHMRVNNIECITKNNLMKPILFITV